MAEPFSVVTDQDFKLVCKNIGTQLKRLGHELGFTEGEVDSMMLDHSQYGTYEVTWKLLNKWRSKHFKEATWMVLVEKLFLIEQTDLAYSILVAHDYVDLYDSMYAEHSIATLTVAPGIKKIPPAKSRPDLYSKINEIQIDLISQEIGNDWERLATQLGISGNERENIRVDQCSVGKGLAAMSDAMLRKFVKKEGDQATLGKVVNALKIIDQKDLADKFL